MLGYYKRLAVSILAFPKFRRLFWESHIMKLFKVKFGKLYST